MNTITLDFSEKEQSVIELMAPGKTAQEVCIIVMRDWFSANVDRMAKTIKTQDQVIDEIIAVSAEKESVKEDVVK